MAGDKFAGIDIEWDYTAHCCHISFRGWIEYFGHFFQNIPFCWYIGKIDELKVLWKKSSRTVSFLWFCHISTYFLLSTIFYLFPSPNTLSSFYYYQIFCKDVVAIQLLSTCHQDCEKNPFRLSCLLDFRCFSTYFRHFSMYSSHFHPDVYF